MVNRLWVFGFIAIGVLMGATMQAASTSELRRYAAPVVSVDEPTAENVCEAPAAIPAADDGYSEALAAH